MPRLLAADKCPKCRGPMTRQTTTAGTIFVCEKCDADDPIKGADKWVKGELVRLPLCLNDPSAHNRAGPLYGRPFRQTEASLRMLTA